jgi:hypothetical protein
LFLGTEQRRFPQHHSRDTHVNLKKYKRKYWKNWIGNFKESKGTRSRYILLKEIYRIWFQIRKSFIGHTHLFSIVWIMLYCRGYFQIFFSPISNIYLWVHLPGFYRRTAQLFSKRATFKFISYSWNAGCVHILYRFIIYNNL